MGLASLILGILSIPASCCFGAGGAFGAPAIVLGAISKRRDSRGKIGMILGIIGYSLSMIIGLISTFWLLFYDIRETSSGYTDTNNYGYNQQYSNNDGSDDAVNSGTVTDVVMNIATDKTAVAVMTVPNGYKPDTEFSSDCYFYYMGTNGEMLKYEIEQYVYDSTVEEYLELQLESDVMDGNLLSKEVSTITDASNREWTAYEYSHELYGYATYCLVFATKLDNDEIVAVTFEGINEPFYAQDYATYIEPSRLEITE